MQTVFSTDGLHPRDSFKRWREALDADGSGGVDLRQLDDAPFQAKVEASTIGPLHMMRLTQSALRTEIRNPAAARQDREEMVTATFKLAGRSNSFQDSRDAVLTPGDLYILDHRPAALTTTAGAQAMFLELPRERFERVLGSIRHYTALPAGAELASTSLARTFFRELIRLGPQRPPDFAAQMASVGVDLIVASIAERLAKEVPRPLHGTVVVQRAKAFVKANFGDPTLDPPQLAAAVGVSLRRLQELFQERGQHISDWIWQRRLEVAAKRLADPGCAHLPIGPLAYGCGFASKAHFSRRFKEHHGMAPREYRHAAFGRTL
ncbi:helix-turn-helix domain-containing protein [Methylobacterium sp. E-066]|uniref:helix-turn-helix domain-containing protein n=1 Tax=Methylobacterium sp. E-066 TaxID=2836584 RepID=UPI001FB8C37C|nr:helix-turn-helix domain-containing protein [Methylobacterium sp. E-066]MCJ2141501.1 helix-turn-helix domain-containing protein [Methylobacterium sp. E-066]